MNEWLVLYDIAHPRRLRRVARRLEQRGARLQKSVFQVSLSVDEARSLGEEILACIDERADRVLYLPMCRRCLARVQWQGKWAPVASEAFWIV